MIKVVKGGLQVLTNFTNEELNKIKKDLTLENPTYKQIKKYSKYRYTSVQPYLTYYNHIDGKLLVPRGYQIPFDYEVIRDDRIENKVLYPKFKLELRKTQKEAVEAWNRDKEKGMIVLPTGKGKTITALYLAYSVKQKTLIIVQKNDLIDGWQKDIQLAFGIKKDKIGLIKAKNFKIGKQFTLATIQTLIRKDTKTLLDLYNTFGMVIVDEAHHVSAKSYEILKNFQSKYFIGLTATDMRNDGLEKTLYWLIGDVAYRAKEDENDEDIMPYTVIIRESNLVYNPPNEYYYKNKIVDEETARVLRESGEYVRRKPLNPQELKRLLKDEKFNRLVARDILHEYRAGKSCIAFLHEKEHIKYLRDILIEYGVPEGQIQLYYGDAKEDDSLMKQRAENKEVLITLATYAKATEGTNVKAWERAFLVTSLNNEKDVIQAVGRCRRRKEGKKDVIVYDYTHPNVKGMRNHIKTRLKAYKKNNANIIGLKQPKRGTLFRGWTKAF